MKRNITVEKKLFRLLVGFGNRIIWGELMDSDDKIAILVLALIICGEVIALLIMGIIHRGCLG